MMIVNGAGGEQVVIKDSHPDACIVSVHPEVASPQIHNDLQIRKDRPERMGGQ
jgi:hypothetical protein